MFSAEFGPIPQCIGWVFFSRNFITTLLHPHLTHLDIGVAYTFHRKHLGEAMTTPKIIIY